MKKTFKFLSCLFVAILCSGQMWGTDPVTIYSATYTSYTPVTLDGKTENKNLQQDLANGERLYAKKGYVMSIDATNGLGFGGKNADNNHCIAIPLTGINSGTIFITITDGYSSAKSSYKWALKHGTSIDNASISFSTTTQQSKSSDVTATTTIDSITSTNCILFIGEASSSYPNIISIEVTTPDAGSGSGTGSSSDAITLDKNGGSANGSGTIEADATSFTPTAPTYSGYSVEGYYTSANCTTKVATAAGALQANITVDETPWTNSSSQWKKGGDATFYTKWKPNTPVISCTANTVTITGPAGATIYYTTDGSTTPTSSSSTYSAPFAIEENTTVKAIAIHSGDAYVDSDVASENCVYSQSVTATWPMVATNALSLVGTASNSTITPSDAVATFTDNIAWGAVETGDYTDYTGQMIRINENGTSNITDDNTSISESVYVKYSITIADGYTFTPTLFSARIGTKGTGNGCAKVELKKGSTSLGATSISTPARTAASTKVASSVFSKSLDDAGTYKAGDVLDLYIFFGGKMKSKSFVLSDVSIQGTYAEASTTAYDVNIADLSNGSISASPTSQEVGEDVTITVTPDTGYELSGSITVTGDVSESAVTATDNNDGTWTFEMPAEDVTVSASFAAIDYAITHSAATNGTYTVSVAGGTATDKNSTANYGQTITLSASPSSDYMLSAWSVIGATSSAAITVTNNQFTMPAEGVTVSATFVSAYTLSYNKNGGSGDAMDNTVGIGSVTLRKNTYTKSDYVFIGWATSSDNAAAGTVAYLDGASYSLSADAELFAVWSPESYSFTPKEVASDDAINDGATVVTSTGGTMVNNAETNDRLVYTAHGLAFKSSGKCKVTITLNEAIQEGTVFTATFAAFGSDAGRGVKLDIDNTVKATWTWDPTANLEEKTFQWTVPAEDDAIGKQEFKLIRVANVYLKSLTVTNTAESTPEDPTPEDPTPEDPSGDEPETPADQVKVFGIQRTVAAETSTSSDNKVTAKRVSDDILVNPSVTGVTITKSYGLQSVMTDKSREIKWFDGTTQQYCYVNVGDNNYRTVFEKGAVPESADAQVSVTSLDERCYFSFELEVEDGYLVSLQALNSDVLKEMYSTHYQVKIYNNGELLKTLEDVGSEYTDSDMKRRFDLSEEAALQNINGTITFKMFVWNTVSTKYVNIKDFTIEATVKQAYARTHSHMNLNTLCYPYQIDTYTGATFYTMLYKVEEASVVTEVVLQEHEGALEAGKPYFYIPEGTKLVCEFSGARENTPVKVNGVQGSYTANTDVPSGSYVTYQGEFRKVGSHVKLGEYRAYVDMDDVALEEAVAPAPGRRILRVRNADAPKITTEVESIQQSAISSQKVLRNGQLYIIRDGKTYNAQGQLVK